MATFTRRGLIKQTSLGAATAGALLAAPSLASVQSASAATAALPREPLAAYVHDAASGEIAFLIGSREIIVHDFDLVRRLVQAAG